MNKEKMMELSKDEKFVAELAKAQTAEEAQKVFSDYGASVTIEELNALSAAAQKDKTGGELADNDLNDVAGGLSPYWSPFIDLRAIMDDYFMNHYRQ